MKNEIIKELKELGWNYIEDEFTKIGRYHFQKYHELKFGEEEIVSTLEYVLIFDNTYGTHMQTSRMCGDKKEVAPFVNKVVYGYYDTIGDVSLSVDELHWFLEFMLLLDKERKEKEKEFEEDEIMA